MITAMNPTTAIDLHIPAAIVALPDLNLIQRVILTRIHKRPFCSNRSLASLTGLSVRGVESTLARLRSQGLIASPDRGPTRRLVLTFPVETRSQGNEIVNVKTHTECGEMRNADSHTKCDLAGTSDSHIESGSQPEPPALTSEDAAREMELLKAEFKAKRYAILNGDFAQARQCDHRIQQWFAKLWQKFPDLRKESEKHTQANEDLTYIAAATWEPSKALTQSEREQLVRLLFDAEPERYAEVRRQIEAATAQGHPLDLRQLLKS